jgi:hypothetical protein
VVHLVEHRAIGATREVLMPKQLKDLNPGERDTYDFLRRAYPHMSEAEAIEWSDEDQGFYHVSAVRPPKKEKHDASDLAPPSRYLVAVSPRCRGRRWHLPDGLLHP